MRVFDNLKLGIKLPLMLVAIAMVALAIMGVSAYREAYGLLESEGKSRLSRTLAARISTLEGWSERVQSEARTLAANPMTARALYDFDKSWKRLGDASAEHLAAAYQGEEGDAAALEGDDLLDFSLQHRRYHPGFEKTVSETGLTNLYLIGRDGRVVYSVEKDAVFGQNLAPESGALGAVVGRAFEDEAGKVAISEILTGQGAPHLFIAAPVVSANGLKVGVLALRVPATAIGMTMTAERGLGQSGDGFLTDAEGRLLSPPRFPGETRKPGARIALPELAAALADGSGVSEGHALSGRPAILAYAPVTLFGTRDIAVVAQDRAELFAPASSLAKSMTFNASWIILLLLAMSALMARSVARPLQELGRSIRAIENGDFDVAIKGTKRKDEVGQMALALDSLRSDLASASAVQKEAAIQGAAFADSSAAMMLIDRDFRITHANKAVIGLVDSYLEEFRKVTPDLESDGLIGRCMDDFHAVPGPARALLEDRARLPAHVDIKVGEGRFGVNVSEICDDSGERLGLVVEWREVTQFRMQRALIDAIEGNQLVCEANPEGAIARLNARCRDLISMDDTALLGQRLRDVLEAVDGSDPWPTVLAGTPVTSRFRLTVPEAGEFLIDGSINPVSDRAGRMMKIVLIANDVTQAEADLARARESAEAMIAQQQSVVHALRHGLNALSKGDLSARINETFASEYEVLRNDFNAAIDTLAAAISAVIENATAIDTEAREISSASDDLSRRTEQQAATLEQTAAALDELSSSVSAAAQGVAEADTVVGAARESAQNSGEIVKQAIQAMSEIESSSRQISKIIGVIDEIAFQTNLLALNAGVEAARAGEAGRGFAVVASEVRALAQRSSEAAREIDTLITASSEHVTRGVGLVGETGKALEGILTSVVDIAGRVSEIASGAQEQSQGLKEINTAMNQLDQVTQQNAAMFEQTTAASHALNANASSLRDTTARFRIAAQMTDRPHALKTKAAPAMRAEPETQSRPALPMPVTQQRGTALRKPIYNEEDWEDF